MAKKKSPVTPAIHFLRDAHVDFSTAHYDYEERGGTARSARCLAVDEFCVIKTLIFQDEKKHPLIVLMHGNFEVSTKSLARHLKVKTLSPCSPAIADRHSGYHVGGTSPFGTRKKMPVYMQESIVTDLDTIFINGGARGFLIQMRPWDAQKILNAELLEMKA